MSSYWGELPSHLQEVIATRKPETEFAKLKILGTFAHRTAVLTILLDNTQADTSLLTGALDVLTAPSFLSRKLTDLESPPLINKRQVLLYFGAHYLLTLGRPDRLELFVSYLRRYWISEDDIENAFTISRSNTRPPRVKRVDTREADYRSVNVLRTQLRLPIDLLPSDLLVPLYTKILLPTEIMSKYNLGTTRTLHTYRRLALLGYSLFTLYGWEYTVEHVDGNLEELAQFHNGLSADWLTKVKLYTDTINTTSMMLIPDDKTVMSIVGLLYFLYLNMSTVTDYLSSWLEPEPIRDDQIPDIVASVVARVFADEE